MSRLLRLPCALLALLLSALGGMRVQAIERLDDDRTKAPVISPAPAIAALPDAPAPLLMLPLALPVVDALARPQALAMVLPRPEGRSLPAPCQRRGSAGGARAP